MIKHSNKWIHGKVNFAFPSPPDGFMKQFGIYYMTLTLDKNVGEEVVLVIYDPTDFINELSAVTPFRFFASSLVINTAYGPVFSFIFRVAQPKDVDDSFAIYDKPIDISKPVQIVPWAKLSEQTHLHLFLVGKNYDVKGFYEFENNFGFDTAVESISMLFPEKVIDFDKALQEYFDNYSLEKLVEIIRLR